MPGLSLIKSGHDDLAMTIYLTPASWHDRLLSEMSFFPHFRT